jgi:ATP-dependent RNA helicase DeaD
MSDENETNESMSSGNEQSHPDQAHHAQPAQQHATQASAHPAGHPQSGHRPVHHEKREHREEHIVHTPAAHEKCAVTFESFNLPEPVAQAVRDLHYDKPTPIQEKSIPLLLDGCDIVGQSETGSGKTAAFGLPVLGQIQGNGIQMLVLTPTRELCNQVCQSLALFSKHLRIRVAAVYGGVGMGPQIQAMRTCNVVVACPGRLLDLMQQRAVDLRFVKFLVLDEADRMFDMGFIRDVEKIIAVTPRNRQTMLFSATMPQQIKALVHRYMRSPVFIETTTHVDKSKLRECYYDVRNDDKLSLLAHLLKTETPGTALVFCRTRHIVDKVARNLRKVGIDATAIHGGLSQNKRDQAINALHKKSTAVLVATDIAGRGLHISDVTHVYNHDLPNVPEDYTHRIGRTARAGAEGDAVTLLGERDRELLKPILRLGHDIKKLPLPTFEKIIIPRSQPGEQGERRFGRSTGSRFPRQGSRHGDNRRGDSGHSSTGGQSGEGRSGAGAGSQGGSHGASGSAGGSRSRRKDGFRGRRW